MRNNKSHKVFSLYHKNKSLYIKNKDITKNLDICDINLIFYKCQQEELDNTGDIDANEMINLCTDISTNFKILKEGEPRILYVHGHIGAYLGKIVSTPEGLCNVVETTTSFGDKISFSWVDPDGKRRNVKNGYAEGKWTKHGLPSLWVKY